MGYLIDSDQLSLTERKNIPHKLSVWLSNTRDIFVSDVSMAELQYGVNTAPTTHRAALDAWLSDRRQPYLASFNISATSTATSGNASGEALSPLAFPDVAVDVAEM